MKSRLAKRANKSQSEYVNIGEKDPEERKGTADENLQLFEKRDAGDLEFFPGEKEEVIALSSSSFFFFTIRRWTNESFRLDRSSLAPLPHFSHPRAKGPLRIHKYFLRLKSFRHEIWVRDTAQPFYRF